MLGEKKKKIKRRAKRIKRIRKKIFGVSEIPRLSVYRSSMHIYAQIIDDEKGETLVSSSTLSKDISLKGAKPWTVAAATIVGKELAKKAKEKKIKEVVFDRRGYKYHGRIKALAEGAREGGLKF